jgi:hypothetical protein
MTTPCHVNVSMHSSEMVLYWGFTVNECQVRTIDTHFGSILVNNKKHYGRCNSLVYRIPLTSLVTYCFPVDISHFRIVNNIIPIYDISLLCDIDSQDVLLINQIADLLHLTPSWNMSLWDGERIYDDSKYINICDFFDEKYNIDSEVSDSEQEIGDL